MWRWRMAKAEDGVPKRDAAKQLGISEHTVDRKLSDLNITCTQLTGPGRRPLIVIAPEDFERLKAEMIPIEAGTVEESTALGPRPTRPTQELIALLRTSLVLDTK